MSIKRILLVEDDPFHAQVVENVLRKAFGKVEIDVVESEKSFLKLLKGGQIWDAVILDQMIPWTTDEDPDPFTDAPEDGPRRAGSRCYQRLVEDRKPLPAMVFFTNLEPQAIPEGAEYVRKKADPKLTALIAKIRDLASVK